MRKWSCMDIIDGHLDLACNALEFHRDLTKPLAVIRRREGVSPAHGRGVATVSLPALREGGVDIVFATLFVNPTNTLTNTGRRTPEEMAQLAHAQLHYYHTLAAKGEVTLITDRRTLYSVLHKASPTPGVVITMEGAAPLLSPAHLQQFVERGVRILGLAWHGNRYASGSESPGPLFDDGRELLREMARLGVTLDISHLAEEAFWQALQLFPGRIIATHANCRALIDTPRQLSDDMIRAIADRDGVIGLVCYNRFLACAEKQERKDDVPLRALLPHIEHLARLVGLHRVALGSDMDGGFGREMIPWELDSIADLRKIADMLHDTGYAQEAIDGMMKENWLRFLRETLP